jgi:hypothetical protein
MTDRFESLLHYFGITSTARLHILISSSFTVNVKLLVSLSSAVNSKMSQHKFQISIQVSRTLEIDLELLVEEDQT